VYGAILTKFALKSLRSGATSRFTSIPLRFFEDIIRLGEDYGGFPPITGNPRFRSQNVWNRLFEILGSQTNILNFVIAHADIKGVKDGVSLSSSNIS
jgi:hypothetical protein